MHHPVRNARLTITCAVAALILTTLGCGESERVLRIATTTSTRDSGLMDHILPTFESRNNCRVDVIAVGTGAAIKLGETGDVDAILVHAEKAELAFVKDGHGIRRELFMSNYFTLIGSKSQTIVRQDQSPAEAFQAIVQHGATFVSRGDDSGTHKRELAIWDSTGGHPTTKGYLETGQGMGPSLIIADEKQAYILCDMGTYLSMKDKLSLVPLIGEFDLLRNPYAAINVNPEKNASINADLAKKFLDILVADETQQAIGDYTVAGETLFRPSRIDPK